MGLALGRGLRNVLLALATFSVGSAVQHSAAPWAEGGGLDTKLEFFERHSERYDAVLVGSSRTLRGLDPNVIGSRLSDEGIAWNVFNFGTPAARTFELDFLLSRVLADASPRLRWVFVEAGPLGLAQPRRNPFEETEEQRTERETQWHTLDETWTVLRCIGPLPLSVLDRARYAGTHLALFGRSFTQLGRGPALLKAWIEGESDLSERAKEATDSLLRAGGYESAETLRGRGRAVAPGGFRKDAAWPGAQRGASVVRQNSLPVRLDEFAWLPVWQVERARRKGIELVFYTVPGPEGHPELLRLHTEGLVPTLFHFNDPLQHPDLFDPAHRFDPGHLNRRGAVLLSEAFADAVAQHLASQSKND